MAQKINLTDDGQDTNDLQTGDIIDFSSSGKASDIADSLSDYRDITPQTTSEPNEPKQPIFDNSPQVDDLSNKEKYYQRGEKKGQIRPSWYRRQGGAAESQPQQETISGNIISGAIFLTIVNLILPILIAFGNNFFSDDKLKPADLSLTDREQRDLEPLADAMLKDMNVTTSPKVLFWVTLLGMYASKLMVLKFSKD